MIPYIDPLLIDIFGLIFWCIGVFITTITLLVLPHLKKGILFLVSFLTCYLKSPLRFTILYQESRGIDTSFVFTLLDLLSVGLFFYLILTFRQRKMCWLPYNSIIWLIFLLIGIFSLFGSEAPYLLGFFTLQKLFFVLMFYWGIVNAIQEKEDVLMILAGLLTVFFFEGFYIFLFKYVSHRDVFRPRGTFGWPNMLAMYLNFLLPIYISLLFVNTQNQFQNLLIGFGILIGIICILFTKSRAGIANMFGVIAIVVVINLLQKPNCYKVFLILLGFFFLTLIGIRSYDKAKIRFEEDVSYALYDPLQEEDLRSLFNAAAKKMALQHFFGVGLNQYSWMLSETDYYWEMYPNAYALLEDPEIWRQTRDIFGNNSGQLGVVHNIYFLTMAELGWLGLFVFILWITRFYFSVVYLFFKTKDPFYKAIFLGIFFGYTTIHFHGFLEWSIRDHNLLYLFFLISGLMVGIKKLLYNNLNSII